MDVSLSKLQEIVKNREPWHAEVHVVAESNMTEQQKCVTPAWVKNEHFFTPENESDLHCYTPGKFCLKLIKST